MNLDPPAGTTKAPTPPPHIRDLIAEACPFLDRINTFLVVIGESALLRQHVYHSLRRTLDKKFEVRRLEIRTVEHLGSLREQEGTRERLWMVEGLGSLEPAMRDRTIVELNLLRNRLIERHKRIWLWLEDVSLLGHLVRLAPDLLSVRSAILRVEPEGGGDGFPRTEEELAALLEEIDRLFPTNQASGSVRLSSLMSNSPPLQPALGHQLDFEVLDATADNPVAALEVILRQLDRALAELRDPESAEAIRLRGYREELRRAVAGALADPPRV